MPRINTTSSPAEAGPAIARLTECVLQAHRPGDYVCNWRDSGIVISLSPYYDCTPDRKARAEAIDHLIPALLASIGESATSTTPQHCPAIPADRAMSLSYRHKLIQLASESMALPSTIGRPSGPTR